MPRNPDWRRVSIVWTALTLVAVSVPVGVLTAHAGVSNVHGMPGALLLIAPLAVPGVALLVRRRWYSYRMAVFLALLCVAVTTILGGAFVGVYFVPACLCALAAAATELLVARAG